jgi:hypothetical protein
MERESEYLIVNGVKFPYPDYGLDIATSQSVSAGRNTNNAFVGQKVGRRLWKINGLQWSDLSVEDWKAMKAAIEPFTVPVTFTGDDNIRRTIYMYPGDTSGKPMRVEDIFHTRMETCKFNLIDCGWD